MKLYHAEYLLTFKTVSAKKRPSPIPKRDYKHRSRKRNCTFKMKNLIEKIQEGQRLIFGQIERNELPIGLANGIRFGDGNMSQDTANTIITNYDSYKKESRRFTDDKTKMVVSRKIFENIISETKFFLIENLDNKGKTLFRLNSEKDQRAIENFEETLPKFIPAIIFTLIAFLGIILSYLYDSKGWTLICGIVSLIGLVRIWAVSFERKHIKRSQKRVSSFNGTDFFIGGHNRTLELKKENSLVQKVTMNFHLPPDYKKMVNLCLESKGKMGYVILRNGPVKIAVNYKREVTINYFGAFVPAILLEETVIFDTQSLELLKQEYDCGRWITVKAQHLV